MTSRNKPRLGELWLGGPSPGRAGPGKAGRGEGGTQLPGPRLGMAGCDMPWRGMVRQGEGNTTTYLRARPGEARLRRGLPGLGKPRLGEARRSPWAH